MTKKKLWTTILWISSISAFCVFGTLTRAFAQEGRSDGSPHDEAWLPITKEIINQDNPANRRWTTVSGNPIQLYGGSEADTSDNLRLTVHIPPGMTPTSITWSCDNMSAVSNPIPSPSACRLTWDCGDIHAGAASSTPLNFWADVVFADPVLGAPPAPPAAGVAPAIIGVRTNDIILVGWIDGTLVPTPNPVGVQAILSLNFTLPPPTVPRDIAKVTNCTLMINDLSLYLNTPGMCAPFTAADSAYVMNWLFTTASNGAPPASFQRGGIFSPAAVTAFLVNRTQQFKLGNELQISYNIAPGGVPGNFNFAAPPTVLRSGTYLGATPTIIGFAASQGGPVDGLLGPVGSNLRISQISDGSPDSHAVCAFDTLATLAPWTNSPLFWEDIGDKITFEPGPGAVDPVLPYACQPYPTYWYYSNGVHVAANDTIQAASPLGNFRPAHAYPFGSFVINNLFLMINDHNGVAKPVQAGARSPLYTVP